MGLEARLDLCFFYTIIFYVSPAEAFTWSLSFVFTGAQLSLTVYEIVLIAH